MTLGNRLRRHRREPIAGRVRVSWMPIGGGGLMQSLVCNAVDISESGLRVATPEVLPVGQYVHLQFEAAGLRGNASIRSCTRGTMRNELGLEFTNGLRYPAKPAPRPEPVGAVAR